MRIVSFSKVVLTLILIILTNQIDIQAQGFRLDDPNIVFKDKNGKILGPDSVKVLVSKGPFSMQQTELENGKKAVIIIPMSNKDLTEKESIENIWKKKWVNTQFPEFQLKNLQGELISNSDLRDKYVIVNFWFIGCKPCIQEIPELNKLVEKYNGDSVLFLAPSFDDMNSLTNFSKKRTFKYTILTGAKNLANEMDVLSYPTHLIIDQKGVIKEILIGGFDDIYSRLDSLIQKIIESSK